MDTNRKDANNKLCEYWEKLNEILFYDGTIDLEKFKILFKQTWQYFLSKEPNNERMSLHDTKLFGLLTPIIWLNYYPKGATCSQFDACRCFVNGLCQSMVFSDYCYEQMKFWDGWITLHTFEGYHCGDESHVHIDNFEKEFMDLCDYYFSNVYEEDEDLDNRL